MLEPTCTQVQKGTAEGQQSQPQVHGHLWKVAASLGSCMRPSEKVSPRGPVSVAPGRQEQDEGEGVLSAAVLSGGERFPPLSPQDQTTLQLRGLLGGDVRFGFTNFCKNRVKGPLCRKSRKSFKVRAKPS